MIPLLMYVLFAGGMAFAVHKKKWGIAVFCGATLLWMLAVQLASAILSFMTRPTTF